MADNQERYYNIKILNKIFAIVSIIFLLAFVWMFIVDYNRPWRKYQKKYREMQIDNTRKSLADELRKVNSGEEYRVLFGEIETVTKSLEEKNDQLDQIVEKIKNLKAKYYRDNQLFQFAKADYDSYKYLYEEELSHKDHVDKASHEEGQSEVEQQFYEAQAAMNEKKLIAQATETELKKAENEKVAFFKEKKALEKEIDALRRNASNVERKLKKLDPVTMTTANMIADMFRDLPIVNFLNPYYKIDQVIVPDVTEDVNFAKVPRVDRCITCHKGILNKEFADAEQPLRTHPNLDLYLSSSSPHPVEKFGCTSCHGGRGRGTDFVSTVHTPSDPDEKAKWVEEHKWEMHHHWEYPMYPTKHIEAGCFKCHSGQTVIKGADKLNLGLALIERSGCYGCHEIDKYKDRKKVGPNLEKVNSKLTPEFIYRWIMDPQSFRSHTWMPAFFNQSNTSDPASISRSEQEVHAMTQYLIHVSENFEMEDIPYVGDAKEGEALVKSLGCLGCHSVDTPDSKRDSSLDSLRLQHGPNLISLGSKTSQRWIYNWIKDPARYHPQTNMPLLRLSDEEASHIATYLTQGKDNAFMSSEIPDIDDALQRKIAFGFLSKLNTDAEAQNEIKSWASDEVLVYNGEKLIGQYGCYACHDIAGFEDAKPIGTSLTEIGSKAINKFDFGFIHEIDHTNFDWINQKLKEPRIFDRDKVKSPDEKLRMPNFNFSDRETEAITTALIGFVKDKPSASIIKERTPKNLFIEEGEALIRELNCQGCHEIDGLGGNIQPSIKDWLVHFEDKTENDAKASALSFSPPNLVGEGKKVQTDWLFKFIHDPMIIRPWLKVRMPTFNLSEDELNTLVKYFSYLDNETFPFVHSDIDSTDEMFEAGEKLFSPDYFDCGQCHIKGDIMPSGSPERWAPNFALSKERLKPEWVVDWLMDPQALLPGTKMPTYFDPEYFEYSGPDDILDGDEHKHIQALRDYIMTFADKEKIKEGLKTEKSALNPIAEKVKSETESS